VQYGVDLAVEGAVADQRDEVALVEVVLDLAVDQVQELLALLQVVDSEDVGASARVERLDEVGADKAGGAGSRRRR